MKKKNIFKLLNFLFIGFILITNYSCDPEEKPKQLATLTTKTITEITTNSANGGGMITSDNGLEVTARGICWSLKPNPSLKDNITTNAAGTGEFVSSLTNLTPDTTYYVRAYATNADGTSYGLQISFKTLKTTIPVLTTNNPTIINNTSAKIGGSITYDGGLAIITKGLCWSKTNNPTINNNKIIISSGTLESDILDLTSGETYYVRAFATNNNGTGYGNEIILNTTIVDIDGNTYHAIKIGTQTWMIENLKTTKYRDGSIVTYNSSNWDNLTTGVWCNYANSDTNGEKFGHLYNYYAVSDSKNLAPIGWHIPTDNEWNTLVTYINNNNCSGTSYSSFTAITNDWIYNSYTPTNCSGFTALPAGGRDLMSFGYINYAALWWSSTKYDSTTAWRYSLYYKDSFVDRRADNLNYGRSIRCIRD